MNLAQFLEIRRNRKAAQFRNRTLCSVCRQPDFSCYCSRLRPFAPKVEFVILIHPLEHRKRIATGRMAHLLLKNSRLIVGYDYSLDETVNSLIADDSKQCVLLYPGVGALDISSPALASGAAWRVPGKDLVVFVIDGTWSTAKKTLWRSQNLRPLARLCFTPTQPSTFRIRKQPAAHCCSTIEAIYRTLDLLAVPMGLLEHPKQHQVLLDSFDWLVERQLEMAQSHHESQGGPKSRHSKAAPPKT